MSALAGLLVIVGDFNDEPNQIPCLLKRIRPGLCEEAWATAAGRAPGLFIGKMLLFCVWRDSLFGDTLVRPYRWLGADMVSSGVILLLLRMVRVFFLTRLGLMKNFVKHGSPTSLARSGGMLACARGRGVCDPGGTKPLSTSTRYKVWRPTVGESALLQQA